MLRQGEGSVEIREGKAPPSLKIRDQKTPKTRHFACSGSATLARNTIVTAINPLYPLTVVTRPTPVQRKAFDLLGVAV